MPQIRINLLSSVISNVNIIGILSSLLTLFYYVSVQNMACNQNLYTTSTTYGLLSNFLSYAGINNGNGGLL